MDPNSQASKLIIQLKPDKFLKYKSKENISSLNSTKYSKYVLDALKKMKFNSRTILQISSVHKKIIQKNTYTKIQCTKSMFFYLK